MTDMYLCANSDGKGEAPEQLFQELDDSHQEKVLGGRIPILKDRYYLVDGVLLPREFLDVVEVGVLTSRGAEFGRLPA